MKPWAGRNPKTGKSGRNSKSNSRKNTPSPQPSVPQEKEEKYSCILPVVASFLCCLPSIDGDLVFDDFETIQNNPVVQGSVPLWQVFIRDYWGTTISSRASHKSYRPLTTITFWLNHQVHGEWILGYHLVNILLHSLVTKEIFRLLKRISENNFLIYAVSLLFAVHPIHTETICNITGRAELLMALFFVVGFRKYLENCEFSQIVAFSISSMLSKEQGIVLPLLIAACGILKIGPQPCNRRIFKSISLFFALFYWRLWIANFDKPTFSKLDNSVAFIEEPISRWLSIVNTWVCNVQLLTLPLWQCFDYSMGCIPAITSFFDIRNARNMLVFGSVIFGIGKCWKAERRMTTVSLLLGGATFAPSSHLFLTVGFTVAERVLYLPSLAYCILAAIGISRVIPNFRKNTLYAVVTVLFALSWQRSMDWRTEYSLYSSGLKVCPDNAKIHYNLGKILTTHGNPIEASMKYGKAIELNPEYEQAMNNLANIFEAQGRYAEAVELLRRATKIRPHFATAWMNLGIAEMKMANFKSSLTAFETSLRLRPHSPDCHFNLGNLHLAAGRGDEAMDSWKRAIEQDPSHPGAWVNILVRLDETGQCERAIEMAGNLPNPAHSAIHFQLGTCYGQLNRFEEGEYHIRKAIHVDLHNKMYHSNLQVLYERRRLFSSKNSTQRNTRRYNTPLRKLGTNITGRL